MWVACVKAWPTALIMGPWLVVQHWHGNLRLPSMRVLLLLVVGALIGQGGNVFYQVALEQIGLALSTPLMMGSLILAGAILGVCALGERVTVGNTIAMIILVIAISVLSLGANLTGSISATSNMSVAWGVMVACLSGVCFGALGVFIRYGVSGRTTIAMTTFTIAMVGIIVLAGACVAHLGIEPLLETTPADFGMMLQAGVWNAVAFLAVTKALQLTSVVYVNTINGSQAAMCAVAGILVFQEPFSLPVVFGVALTISALLVMQLDRKPDPQQQAK